MLLLVTVQAMLPSVPLWCRRRHYSLARSGTLKLPGFPCFETMVADLKKNAHDVPAPTFEVCVPVPNGLAVKQNLVDYWGGIESYQLEVGELVKKHNAKYNPHGIKRGAAEIPGLKLMVAWHLTACCCRKRYIAVHYTVNLWMFLFVIF